MMKKFAYLILFVVPFVGMTQTKSITIDWQYAPITPQVITASQKKSVAVKGTAKTPVSRAAVAEKASKKALEKLQFSNTEDGFYFTQQWDDSRYVDPNSIRVTNVRYKNLTPYEKSKIETKNIPTSLEYSIRTTSARGKIATLFDVTPIISDNGILKKITSFSIDYSYKSNASRNNVPGISNSVLANGDWFKFKVTETGVQRLTSSFLNDLGVNLSQIDPQTIKIYGHGGQPLSLLNSQNIHFDLPQVPIQVQGGEDGEFGANDFILFYGTNTLGYNGENDSHVNPYADDSYYYLTYGGAAGKRILPLSEPGGAGTIQITTYDDEQFFEEDLRNPGRLGRRWVGDPFLFDDETFDFDFSNADTSKPFIVDVQVAAISDNNTFMNVTLNGASVDPITNNPVSSTKPIDFSEATYQVPASNNLSVVLSYNNAGNPSSIGYLDYIRVRGSRQLVVNGEQFIFENRDVATQTGVGQYQFSNASQIAAVWDITDPFQIFGKRNANNDPQFSFKAALGSRKKYIAVHSNDYHQPQQVSNRVVANQNLKGRVFQDEQGNFSDIDYIIITAPFLIQPALRLANHHKNLNNLKVKVVTTNEIYEEFSSGKQDISAIRNFVRYVYNNASSEQNRLKYLCLFGDTSVDYKDRFPSNNNIVPTFHTLSSTSTVSSFMSDDFFGNIDEDEGKIGVSPASPLISQTGEVFDSVSDDLDKLDVAIGRILVDEVSLANSLVSKIINYSTEPSFGNWRNNFTLISDDVDIAWEFDFLQVTLDELGDEIEFEKPFINVTKIHSDAFQQLSSAGGDRYPSVNEAIIEAVEVGSLIITYFGHGGEDGLAKEFIVTREMTETFNNENRYPCFVTVTCEFTQFDNPLRITAGELMFWNERGGAISMVTTTRSITVQLGVNFNSALASQLFGFGTNDIPTPAEALRVSKNEISDRLRRVIFYIGDPAMDLAFPKQQINLTTVNGQPIENNQIVLEALSRVTLGGTVTDAQGNLQSNYNGILEAKIFDKRVEKTTLGNDGITINGELAIFDFEVLGEGIFNGQASVTGGRFNFDFVVPRDIQIPVGAGRVSFYSKRNNMLEDNTGASVDILVGGLNENAPVDNTGPEIQLFMNDESFINGGITNNSPNLIAKLTDENGINTASGIGHDMIAILDGDESNPFVLNEFYQAEVDDFTRGTTNYKLRDLEDGLHTLTFKAWDVYNNSATAEIQFLVAGDDVLKIDRVLNYPNPFVDYTEFWFEHNRPSEPLSVQVQIFTVSGKIVKTINQQITTIGTRSRDIIWDGRDDFGEKIGKGTYVYKITVKSTLTNKQVEKFEKLVIL